MKMLILYANIFMWYCILGAFMVLLMVLIEYVVNKRDISRITQKDVARVFLYSPVYFLMLIGEIAKIVLTGVFKILYWMFAIPIALFSDFCKAIFFIAKDNITEMKYR